MNEAFRPSLPGFIPGLVKAFVDVIGSDADQQDWRYGSAFPGRIYGSRTAFHFIGNRRSVKFFTDWVR